MKSRISNLLGLAAVATLGMLSCSDQFFGEVKGRRRLVVDLCDAKGSCDVPPPTLGTRAAPLPLVMNTPTPFKLRVRALLPDGTPDTAFSSYVRISAKPGSVAPLSGEGASGRNVLLTAGQSAPVDVMVVNAFGTSYLLADDLGYVPTDPTRQPPPACADGLDNDGDGLVDFPADPGCAFANDDSELGGTYEEGASPPIFFPLPRIADARGLTCDPVLGCSGSGITPYQKDQVLIDTGYHSRADGSQGFDFNVVVVRVSASGFFFTDLADARGGFTSLYAFNFNAPPRMRVCDRLTSVAGTAGEFFGLTQISYPTWTLEEWDPTKRPCLVPEPTILKTGDLGDSTALLKLTAGLVRVQTLPDRTQITHIASKLGQGNVPKDPTTGAYLPGPDATNCDFNKDAKIDFSLGSEEGACSNACTADVECVEYSNFIARSTFRVVTTDSNKQSAAIQADASAASGFDVLAAKGQEVRSFTGALTYFSGGSQFTIEARCDDDIVVPKDKQPFPSDQACVLPRTALELNPQ